MRLSNDKLKLIKQLPQKQQLKIKQVVRTYISACRRNGCDLGNLERVYLEAFEVVYLEARHQPSQIEDLPDWEPARRYEQYIGWKDM